MSLPATTSRRRDWIVSSTVLRSKYGRGMGFSAYDAALHAIGRSRGLLAGDRATRRRVAFNPATGARLVRKAQLPSEIRGDMRRLSVVMAVAALDTYMHRLIVERVYTHKDLPNGLARLEIGFEQLLSQADATAAAARQPPSNPRPRVGVKRLLRDRLLRETFQTYEAVSRALGMAGRSKAWPSIGEKMSPPRQPPEIKRRLNEIVTRRNQIVHEGDYERLEKPRGPRRNGMSYRRAKGDIDFIEEIIRAIHGVVS
jgi:RiboL-PSP-HEPN